MIDVPLNQTKVNTLTFLLWQRTTIYKTRKKNVLPGWGLKLLNDSCIIIILQMLDCGLF